MRNPTILSQLSPTTHPPAAGAPSAAAATPRLYASSVCFACSYDAS